jgi:hypothetical protein
MVLVDEPPASPARDPSVATQRRLPDQTDAGSEAPEPPESSVPPAPSVPAVPEVPSAPTAPDDGSAVEDPDATSSHDRTDGNRAGPPTGDADEAAPPADAVDETWTIEPGEHLWAIAEGTLSDHRPTPPTDAEIAAYLQLVIALNRSRLADPNNPDLVYPGQVMQLPPVPFG